MGALGWFRAFGFLGFLRGLLSLWILFHLVTIFVTVVTSSGLPLVVDQAGVSTNADTCGDSGMKLDFHLESSGVYISEHHWTNSLNFSVLREKLCNSFCWKTIWQMCDSQPTVVLDRSDRNRVASKGQPSVTSILQYS